MDVRRKLTVLADAARFDAPCAARLGTTTPARPTAAAAGGATAWPALVDPGAAAICHAVAGDGRRVPLLKLLLSNHCIHDCAYCPSRRSADAERARFTVQEVVRLTLDYHRRGIVEGLFLSSAVDRDADDTMERLVSVARTLRRDHGFQGYVHLKVIPEASPALVAETGRWADRLSVNVELPTQRGLDPLAPGRRHATIRRAMDGIRDEIAAAHEERRHTWRAPGFAPAGQVTQLVVGADAATDAEILDAAASLYARQRLRRVYYGAFVPLPELPAGLPSVGPSPLRERRLYQADWLLRHYGFGVDELAPSDAPDLPLDVDPKLAWALRHPEAFPVDLNRAPRELLLRVPGLGVQTVERLLAQRAWRRVRVADLVRLHVPVARALPFVVAVDHLPRLIDASPALLRERFVPRAAQLDLFPDAA